MSTVITLPLYKHGLEHGVQVAGRTLADLSTGTRACHGRPWYSEGRGDAGPRESRPGRGARADSEHEEAASPPQLHARQSHKEQNASTLRSSREDTTAFPYRWSLHDQKRQKGRKARGEGQRERPTSVPKVGLQSALLVPPRRERRKPGRSKSSRQVCVWGGASVLPKIHRWAVSIPHGEPGPEPNTSCPQAQTLGGSSDVTGLLAPTWETWRASQGRERPRRGSLILSADSCLELPQGDTVPEMAGASTARSGQ